MLKHHAWKIGRTAGALGVLAGVGLFASPAMAFTGNEVVAGTAAGSLSLTSANATLGTAVPLTNFAPGMTATGSGAVTAVSTDPNWSLTVADANTNQTQASGATSGELAPAGAGCSASSPASAFSSSPLKVYISSVTNVPLGGTVSPTAHDAASAVSLASGGPLASATSQVLALTVFNTAYSVAVPSTAVLATTCAYSLTSVYTLTGN